MRYSPADAPDPPTSEQTDERGFLRRCPIVGLACRPTCLDTSKTTGLAALRPAPAVGHCTPGVDHTSLKPQCLAKTTLLYFEPHLGANVSKAERKRDKKYALSPKTPSMMTSKSLRDIRRIFFPQGFGIR